MLAFPSMISDDARTAGIKVPDDPDSEYRIDDYPHFAGLCNVTLDRPINWSEMRETIRHNAAVIAAIPAGEIKTVTMMNLWDAGLRA